jgi:type I restriction enzyme M protein
VAHEPLLAGLNADTKPKKVIHTLAEDLLARFDGFPLLSKYDAYQQLMDYWEATMQDDVYLIVAEGWENAAKPRALIAEKGQKLEETPDLVIGKKKYKMDLLPPALLISRYFAEEAEELEALREIRETTARVYAEFIEERSGEEGVLEEATNDKGEITKTEVIRRIKLIFGDPDSDDERDALEQCLAYIDMEGAASKVLRAAQEKLDVAVLERYALLTEMDIEQLVICDKWSTHLRMTIEEIVHSIVQGLMSRLRTLEIRYEEPQFRLDDKLDHLSERVERHLQRMGMQP